MSAPPQPDRVLVVGFDGSESSQRALQWARDRAGAGGRVVVVHAYHPPPDWEGTPFWGKSLAHHQAFGRELLDGIEASGLPGVETDLLEGPAATALTKAAEAHQADEIVIGSHGHRRLAAALGGVATALLAHADRPVVVIPSARED
jgi:nucleotide-binding universal stress UspA family protein